MKKTIAAATLFSFCAVGVGAYVRPRQFASKTTGGVYIERFMRGTYVEEILNCNIYVPADQGGTGQRFYSNCTDLWAVSDDGKTRFRIARFSGENATARAQTLGQLYDAITRLELFEAPGFDPDDLHP